MNKKENNSRGFTLVEIIVTLSILTIVLTVAGSVYFYGIRMYTSTETKNSAKYIGDSAYDYMHTRLITATYLEVAPDGSTPKYNTVFQNQSGKLYWGEKNTTSNVFGDNWYGNYTIKYNVKPVENNPQVLELEVLVLDSNGETAYTTKATLKDINIDKGNGAIEFKNLTASYENPVISYSNAEETINANMQAAITLRNYYIDVYEKMWDLKASGYTPTNNKEEWEKQLPGWTGYNLGNEGYSNDKISKYVYYRYYANGWYRYDTSLDEGVVAQAPFNYVKNYYDTNPTLYLHPYCGSFTGGRDWAEKNVFVFVSTKADITGNWSGVAFIIDTPEKTQYVTTNKTGSPTKLNPSAGIAIGKTWEEQKKLLVEPNWLVFK